MVLNQVTGEFLTDKLFGETLIITSKINGRPRRGAKLLSQISAVYVTSGIPSRLKKKLGLGNTRAAVSPHTSDA